MQKFKVTGMNCAACSARVETAVSKLNGVTLCNVNLLTGDMTVEGSVASQDIVNTVAAAGYGIVPLNNKGIAQSAEALDSKSDKTILFRLIASAVLLVVLMYFSMLHTMWGFLLPKVLMQNYLAQATIQMLLATVILIINRHFFINGFKGLVNRAPNMDTLVAIGSASAYIYSIVNLFSMITANAQQSRYLLHGMYFDSAAMILTLITVGKLLESNAKGKTTNAIKSLLELAPKTVTLLKKGKEITVNTDSILTDDIFVVRAGESFAVDGVVIEGSSAVDEASLTGEAIPVDKTEGSMVYSGTINKSGKLICRATAVGEDSTLAKIVKIVSDAASTKAPIARIADKISSIFVPIVLMIAVVTLLIWLLLGSLWGVALSHAISVLVISCPCALGLATPVAIMVASGVGAKHGILFKTAVSIELCGKCNVILLDKTGTVTEGKPVVTDIIPIATDKNTLLQIAYTLEQGSAHPLATAVNDYARQTDVTVLKTENFNETAGFGVEGIINGRACVACSVPSAKENGITTNDVEEIADNLSSEGKTPLLFVQEGKILGIIAVADTIKPDAKSAVSLLKKHGFRVIMLTGDNTVNAAAVAAQVGIEEFRAQVKPNEKAAIISEYKAKGRTVMVGDGINDAPALTTADIGMAIASGMDIAIESADIVLTNSRLADVVNAILLSRRTIRNIKQNLFWAFAYNTVGIPIAAGAFVWAGIRLSPMLAAAAMSLSSFCVVSNALRINLFGHKKKRMIKAMKKTIKIDGMMCPHCEAHVKTALEALKGVKNATVSHISGIAVVELLNDIDDKALKSTVENQGYTVLNIE